LVDPSSTARTLQQETSCQGYGGHNKEKTDTETEIKECNFLFLLCALITYDMYLIPIYQIFSKKIHALKAVVVFSFINNPALVFSFIDVSFIVLKFIKHLNTKKKKN